MHEVNSFQPNRCVECIVIDQPLFIVTSLALRIGPPLIGSSGSGGNLPAISVI